MVWSGRWSRAAAAGGLAGARVLEIGGGIGAMQAELLEAGAERGEIVELVAACEPYALELARERGLAERTTFRVVDILETSRSRRSPPTSWSSTASCAALRTASR